MRNDDDDDDKCCFECNDNHNNHDNDKIMMEDSSSSLEMVNVKFDEVCDDPSRNNKDHMHHNYRHYQYRNDRLGRYTTRQRCNRRDDLDHHHRHPPSIQLSYHQHTNNNSKIIPPIKPLSSIRIGRMILIVIFILLLITFYLLLLYTVISSWNDTNVVDLIVDS